MITYVFDSIVYYVHLEKINRSVQTFCTDRYTLGLATKRLRAEYIVTVIWDQNKRIKIIYVFDNTRTNGRRPIYELKQKSHNYLLLSNCIARENKKKKKTMI